MADGPLEGVKIIELAGIGPGPYAGQLLADLGATVVTIMRPSPAPVPGAATTQSVDMRGKKIIKLDLRQAAGAATVLRLVKNADILFEGNRPGVAERLGVGPGDCHSVNPKLVYGRMTGWGQTGPWAQMAGHDLNYIGLTGALEAMGRKGEPPRPPLNLVGDYGGGSLFMVMGLLAALYRAQISGRGDVVDAAIIDGTSSMMGIVYSLHALGLWRNERQANLLDGNMPYYRCYATRDGKFMAVGCIEPQFFALMLKMLEIDPAEFGGQNDPTAWPGQHKQLEQIFLRKDRDEWAALFDGSDACVTPVLDYLEAAHHPQNAARSGLEEIAGVIHPAKAPVFERRYGASLKEKLEEETIEPRDILKLEGFSTEEISELYENNVMSN